MNQAHIKQITSGSIVALNVDADVNVFREFVGPFDPVSRHTKIRTISADIPFYIYVFLHIQDVARKLKPLSLRARFGRDTTLNAIHCTDLPADGSREVLKEFDSECYSVWRLKRGFFLRI